MSKRSYANAVHVALAGAGCSPPVESGFLAPCDRQDPTQFNKLVAELK